MISCDAVEQTDRSKNAVFKRVSRHCKAWRDTVHDDFGHDRRKGNEQFIRLIPAKAVCQAMAITFDILFSSFHNKQLFSLELIRGDLLIYFNTRINRTVFISRIYYYEKVKERKGVRFCRKTSTLRISCSKKECDANRAVVGTSVHVVSYLITVLGFHRCLFFVERFANTLFFQKIR